MLLPKPEAWPWQQGLAPRSTGRLVCRVFKHKELNLNPYSLIGIFFWIRCTSAELQLHIHMLKK